MMDDNHIFSLDNISTHDDFNLQTLCQDTELDLEYEDSPYAQANNTCSYYDPNSVKDINSNDLSLFCMNVQGLRAHWDAFHDLINNLSGETWSFNIIAITELFSMAKGECDLHGYHPLYYSTRNDTNQSKGGCRRLCQQ